MNNRRLLSLIFILGVAPLLGSCSKALIGSELLDMGVTSNGLIQETAAQSCVDKSTPTAPPTYSLAANALFFNGFSINWKSDSLDLYIGEIKITVLSNRIASGQYQTTLDPTEVEALLGAPSATLLHAATAGGTRLYYSTNTSKGTSSTGTTLVSCGLAAGGITLADPTTNGQKFTAQVRIDLIGTATNPNDQNAAPQTVLKSITTQVTYY